MSTIHIDKQYPLSAVVSNPLFSPYLPLVSRADADAK